MTRLAALCLFLVSAAGCVAWKSEPMPEVAERAPQARRIYVVGEPQWYKPAELAAQLEAAGFAPILVSRADAVPADAPWIDEVEVADRDFDGCRSLWNVLAGLTLFVFPAAGCDRFGARFALHPTRDAPAQTVDTLWQVDTLTGWFVWFVAVLPDWHARPYELPSDLAGDYPLRALRVAILDALGPAEVR